MGSQLKDMGYQVNVSVTTKPQSASLSELPELMGSQLKVSMSVTTRPWGLLFPELVEPLGFRLKDLGIKWACL